jgi:flagellar protein FlaI
MDQEKLMALESRLVDKLPGKLTLLQPQEEREAIVDAALGDILKSPEGEKFKQGVADFSDPTERIRFVTNFLSYGLLEDLLCDVDIEDIIINSLNVIYVHHAQKGFIPTGRRFPTQKDLDLFVRKLILFSGRLGMGKIINLELPYLQGRVNIAVSPFGPQVTITKAKVEPLSMMDLINNGTLNYDVAAQLWLYLEGLSIRPANIIIAGGPGTGKTTLLNALFSFIPENHHVVVIEDTLELNTFLEESCSRLESDEGLSLADLVKNSLRMRPERIVVGEVRGEEARDMITAVNIGKTCMGTIHALTSREAILRLQNEPMNIPEILVNLVDVFIVLKRYHVQNKLFRVIDEVSESGGMEHKTVLLSQIYKYDYEQNKVKSISTSTVYRDRLAREAGVSPRDVIDEVRLRAFVLKTLAERGIQTMKEMTTFCRVYGRDPKQALLSLGFERDKLLGKKK